MRKVYQAPGGAVAPEGAVSHGLILQPVPVPASCCWYMLATLIPLIPCLPCHADPAETQHGTTAGGAGVGGERRKKESTTAPSVAPRAYITEAELSGVSAYMKGRLTQEKVCQQGGSQQGVVSGPWNMGSGGVECVDW
jgi:hypothetical protein